MPPRRAAQPRDLRRQNGYAADESLPPLDVSRVLVGSGVVRSAGVAALLGLAALGCEPGGVGDPCTPEDEYEPSFSGFAQTEVNVESRSFQCETRLCLVNHFKGRVSCPYGQG